MGDCIRVLMEGVPASTQILKLRSDINNIESVAAVHDIHVWALSPGKVALSAHI